MMNVPFNDPGALGDELAYVGDAIAQGRLASGGVFTQRCETLMEQALGVPRALLTTSCTHALEMAALLLDIGPGDEVILPSFTFTSTANAFVLRGARPVFADVRPGTLNLDELRLERLITPRTRAIVPVHYAGVGCRMDAIMALAAAHGVAVVEDNAHGLFGSYRGRCLGTFGALATLSFHETKNITCGEGGMLLINEPRLVERAEIIRDKGTDRSRFLRGEVDKYSWVGVGSSYGLSDILAAFLLAQLEAAERIQARRRRLWESYRARLDDWAHANDVLLPTVPDDCAQAYHLFYLLLPTEERRQSLIAHLADRGVASAFHYVPLHLSPLGRRWGYQPGDLPVTERIGDQLLRLPLSNGLTDEQQDAVVAAIHDWRERA